MCWGGVSQVKTMGKVFSGCMNKHWQKYEGGNISVCSGSNMGSSTSGAREVK